MKAPYVVIGAIILVWLVLAFNKGTSLLPAISQTLNQTETELVLPPFSSVDLRLLERETISAELLFRSPLYQSDEREVEDRSFIRLLPLSLHRYIATLNGIPAEDLPLTVLDQVLPKKRFYFDMGANKFNSSVGWMQQNYPVTFTEIFAWEAEKQLFIKPTPEQAGREFGLSHEQATAWLDSITFIEKMITTYESAGTTDLVAFLESRVSPEDFVVVKMDIEGGEWQLLPLLESSGALRLIDELLVEIHFAGSHLDRYGWNSFAPHTLQDTSDLVNRLQETKGLFFHYWP